ncbi:VWA domain-containing protein [Stutzerimonas azotifigens]|uniref:VWA domain-containing protein n=1 Tax=Stutzerimonas azotifigens TaxID=291995 RepID=UPI00040EC3C4|nr:VWA domain-containing protein [Stutzerimonas azotifigens]
MLELAWPWVFLLAPLPWLLRRLLPASDSREAALKVTFLGELATLSDRKAGIGLPGWRQQLPYVLIWLALLVAAARPQWLGEPLPQPTTGRDLLLAVDVSGSMDYPDMLWEDEEISRLELVKRLLGDFLEARHGDRVGLILFGSKAYLQAPLTFDRHTVRVWLDEALIGIAGSNTAIGDAIGLALKRLGERPVQSRVLILVTDGANNGGEIEPLVAAELAAREGVRIHTIGIGAEPDADGVLGRFGFSAGMELDETTLRGVAEATGGRYFRAQSREALQAIGETLDELEPAAQRPERARLVKALYPWPLAAALLGSLLLVARSLWPRRWRLSGPGGARR